MFNIFPTFSDYISDVGKVEKSGRRMLLECDCYSAASIAILLFQVRILIEGDIQQRVIFIREITVFIMGQKTLCPPKLSLAKWIK